MEIKNSERDRTTIVAPHGSVDATTAGGLSDHITGLIESGVTQLVVDLAGVDYMSSAGLRVLLGAAKGTRAQGGDLRLASVQDDVQKVLSLSGFTSILKIYDDVDDAVASYA
jgi:anti-anti-sigma factor